jgi:hypothetical protein
MRIATDVHRRKLWTLIFKVAAATVVILLWFALVCGSFALVCFGLRLVCFGWFALVGSY